MLLTSELNAFIVIDNGRTIIWCIPSPLPTRKILGISWRDHATTEEVMRRAGMERLQDIVTMRRNILDHIIRVQGERPAHTPIYRVPEYGMRSRGRPNEVRRSTFKEDLEDMGVIGADEEFWPPNAPRGYAIRNLLETSLVISFASRW